MSQDINALTITGNLTRDVELRTTTSGTAIASLRIANNGRRKDPQTQQWVDKPRYFNVVVFGATAQNCAQFLAKGSRVAIHGELDWRDYDDKQNPGKKREAIEIKADQVLFLDPRGQNQPAPQAQQAPPQQYYGGYPNQQQYAPQPVPQPQPQHVAPQPQQMAPQPQPGQPQPGPQQQPAPQQQQPTAAPMPVGAGAPAGEGDLPF